jgi:hypothetical protein
MDSTLNNVLSLFDSSGKNDADLEREIHLPRSIIYDWRNSRSKSYKKYLPQIASYFGISLDWLAGNNHELPPLTKQDERDISKRLNKTLKDLESAQGGLMFDGEPMDDVTKELLIESLRKDLEMGKRIAKRKYTPKKYRKKSE